MNEANGSEAILALPRPNFYNDMLGILHIGNGALPAFTMGAVILTLISTNYINAPGTATLTTYLIPYVSYGLADITGIVLPDWFTHGFMGIVNCLLFAFAIIGVTWLLGKIHIKLKI